MKKIVFLCLSLMVFGISDRAKAEATDDQTIERAGKLAEAVLATQNVRCSYQNSGYGPDIGDVELTHHGYLGLTDSSQNSKKGVVELGWSESECEDSEGLEFETADFFALFAGRRTKVDGWYTQSDPNTEMRIVVSCSLKKATRKDK